MFTGIIEATAVILENTNGRLILERPISFDDIRVGSSIAVSGVCLSVICFDDTSMQFDVVHETMECTKLGTLMACDSVNLERSVKVGDRLEGHMVQGHVEGVGKVIEVVRAPAPTPFPSPGTGEGRRGGGVSRGIGKWKYPVSAVVSHARQMRKSPTRAEDVLWESLRRNALYGAYFRRQRPVANYILDFYCEEAKLAIEIDGVGHLHNEQKSYDVERTAELEARGIQVVRFKNQDVLQNLETVLEEIAALLPQKESTPGILLTVHIPDDLLPFIVQKGSITLDGVSLTVASLDGNACSIALIPHTLEKTTLGSLQGGDAIHIETDILGRYVLHKQLSSEYTPSV